MKKAAEEKPERTKWVITPGLYPAVKMLESLYKTAFKGQDYGKLRPILIHGPRGVGKTVFTDILVELFKEDNHGLKFERANIAAFSNELIGSELFGHVKGSFTGAIKDRPGLIEKCDNGILILEEIGEIPLHVQAKLLTFMESGQYRRVGEDDVRTVSNLQIIGTTNKNLDDPSLKPDFIDRFIDFKILPIHQRREDVLYSLAWLYPEIISQMYPYEVTSFLAHNWPGNFREIEKVVQTRRLERDWKGQGPFDEREADFYAINILNKIPFLGLKLYEPWETAIEENGIDTEFLERSLNKYGLGFSDAGPAFPKFPKRKDDTFETDPDFEKRFGITRIVEARRLRQANKGLSLFCDLFAINRASDQNLFRVIGKMKNIHNPLAPKPDHFSKKEAELKNEIRDVIQKMAAKKTDTFERITSLRETDLLEKYWRELWRECDGKAPELMQRSGMKKTAVYKRIKKYDLK
jgi:hypothetical protein